ncbi:MAG: hypothetical protein IKI92_03870, partial [Anaerotignum sp.]|nr:hypothetical protein [Anaerotignum sp.]
MCEGEQECVTAHSCSRHPAEDEVVLENLPFIRDVRQTLDILKELGCRVEIYGRTAVIDSSSLKKT